MTLGYHSGTGVERTTPSAGEKRPVEGGEKTSVFFGSVFLQLLHELLFQSSICPLSAGLGPTASWHYTGTFFTVSYLIITLTYKEDTASSGFKMSKLRPCKAEWSPTPYPSPCLVNPTPGVQSTLRTQGSFVSSTSSATFPDHYLPSNLARILPWLSSREKVFPPLSIYSNWGPRIILE